MTDNNAGHIKLIRMKNWKEWNDDFFSLFVMGLILMANCVAVVFSIFEQDWTWTAFHVLMVTFAVAVIVHIVKKNC